MPCRTAALEDIDFLVLREFLGMLRLPHPVDYYLEPENVIEAGMPSLVWGTRGTDEAERVVPRNVTLILFGKEPRKFFPGAFVQVTIYPGRGKAAPQIQGVDVIQGPISLVIRDIMRIFRAESGILIDKDSSPGAGSWNKPRYSKEVLQEALLNALVHRDYASLEPCRVELFSDRIVFSSPGGLPSGVDVNRFRMGEASPQWRNPELADFSQKLGFAQRRGSGIP